jgi:hypothetical protein
MPVIRLGSPGSFAAGHLLNVVEVPRWFRAELQGQGVEARAKRTMQKWNARIRMTRTGGACQSCSMRMRTGPMVPAISLAHASVIVSFFGL